MQLQSINSDMRLYCIAGGTCYGFDVLDRKARAVAEWLRANSMPCSSYASAARELVPLDPKRHGQAPQPGTAEHFAACDAVMVAGAKFNANTGKRCPAELVPAFIGREGERVECDYYGERVRFTVGKSTGWLPCHLRLKTSRSSGGEALSASAISNVRFI